MQELWSEVVPFATKNRPPLGVMVQDLHLPVTYELLRSSLEYRRNNHSLLPEWMTPDVRGSHPGILRSFKGVTLMYVDHILAFLRASMGDSNVRG